MIELFFLDGSLTDLNSIIEGYCSSLIYPSLYLMPTETLGVIVVLG